ncbi:hypothetical protein K2173_010065 [Erythroxylum novogranatense]|uniref:SET domain-containing protein n=1 Tax=Erythroxylum novogranatense TaxID=1862640 RepID=A0AAV8T0N7_9ROSI|nr:hypothetical protein K2173_010065 [Erythroxylum novogranatense]
MESEDGGLVKTVEIPGRGRGVVSCKPLRAGQIVLRDSPILLYSASRLTNQQHSSYNYCNNCFRNLQQQQQQITLLSCPNCSNRRFCGSACLSAATSSSHSPWACQSLSRLRDFPSLHNQPLERHLQLRFLVAAYNLAFFNPSHFQSLLSLQPHSNRPDNVDEETQFLHSVISTLCSPSSNTSFFDLQLTSTLLAKDKLNSFALMEPFSVDGQRSVRAYGVYPNASLFNHDCLPNACRFDYVDSVDANNTDIIVRMIHDVPQGREICLSYFPVNWDYPTRQKRLLEDYGFYCQCDRCKVEANWSDNDDDKDDIVVDENEVMDDDEGEEQVDDDVMEAIQDDVDSNFPHAYFFVRYMCDRENCGGTLAPLPPSDPRPSSLLECNVCGNIKKDEIVDADVGGAS